jgi:hypothetical protein
VPTGFGWSRGVDGDYLADLISYWADACDWREHETRLHKLPWVLTGDGDTRSGRFTNERRRRAPSRRCCCSCT